MCFKQSLGAMFFGGESFILQMIEGNGVAIGQRLQAGMTWINDHLAQPADLPFGGIKSSGIGREGGGEIGLREFVEMQTLTIPKPRPAKK